MHNRNIEQGTRNFELKSEIGISNKEQRILKSGLELTTSKFDIPCSLFDIKKGFGISQNPRFPS
jgi:hypothetical protein